MNIYLVSREDEDSGCRDQLHKAVVVAPNHEGARGFAALAHGDEGFDFWWTNNATVHHLGITLEDDLTPGIVCMDFPPG